MGFTGIRQRTFWIKVLAPSISMDLSGWSRHNFSSWHLSWKSCSSYSPSFRSGFSTSLSMTSRRLETTSSSSLTLFTCLSWISFQPCWCWKSGRSSKDLKFTREKWHRLASSQRIYRRLKRISTEEFSYTNQRSYWSQWFEYLHSFSWLLRSCSGWDLRTST